MVASIQRERRYPSGRSWRRKIGPMREEEDV
jgi:hypothetical protein